MKKTFLLLFAALLMQGTAHAANYNIWVSGIRVTDANKDDVQGDGKVSYDPAAKTLHIQDGAHLGQRDDAALEFQGSDETISVKIYGTVLLESMNGAGIRVRNNKGFYPDAVIKAGATKATAVPTLATELAGKRYVSITPTAGTGITTLSRQGIKVWGGKGTIQILAPQPPKGGAVTAADVQVYNAQGALVRTAAIGCGDFQIADIPAGIYIVKIGSAAAEKVMVR